MNREQATQLVEQALKNSFDQDTFLHFVRNVLNHVGLPFGREGHRRAGQAP